MIKKTITYVDFNNKTRTEDFYFNLTKAELARLQLTAPGGDLSAHIQKLQDNNSRIELMEAFEGIITMSFGERTEDGRHFMKPAGSAPRFMSSAAYSELFIELISDPEKLTEFVKGLIPSELGESVDEKLATAQSARERSEAQLQGFKKKEAPKVGSTMEVIPGEFEDVLKSEGEAEVDLSQLSKEELVARLSQQ